MRLQEEILVIGRSDELIHEKARLGVVVAKRVAIGVM
jgi:hypothetical protein